jgi:ubiquitin thioesterase OTU1
VCAVPPNFRTTGLQFLFAPDDVDALAGAQAIAEEANKRGAFTDLNNFTLMCLVCNTGVVGQKDAVSHAKATGHVNFGEYTKPK